MARTKGSHDIAPMIRGAFIRAAKSLEDNGKPLSTMIEECLQERPLDTLKAIAHFVPKEMLIEADITHTLEQMTDEALDHEIRRITQETKGLSLPAGISEETQH